MKPTALHVQVLSSIVKDSAIRTLGIIWQSRSLSWFLPCGSRRNSGRPQYLLGRCVRLIVQCDHTLGCSQTENMERE
jgi:hypothetical protein